MYSPLVVVVGPTASGKTDLAIKLAKQFNGEIVSADSWMVRKGLDIGTAKPTIAERQDISHHLIDIIEPDQDFSASLFKDLALSAIKDISSRNKLPILVGGTGLYIDSVIYNYSFLPSSDSKSRALFNNMSLAQLHALATERGLRLETIDKRNKRRVIRLIETNGGVASKHPLRENSLVVGLSIDKDRLLNQVETRVENMIDRELEDEVRVNYLKYGWECEALKGIGYHEWRLYFEKSQTLDETKYRIIKDTIMLAKRQATWFKRNKSIQWFTTPVNYSEVADTVTTFLSNNI